MKTNELMFGDWVRWEQDGGFYQISEISETVDGEPSVCFMGYNYMVNLDEIEPVPLTPEILKKNGFKLKPDGWIWCSLPDFEDKSYIFIQFRKGCEEVRLVELNFVNKVLAKYEQMHYVHELQHALRLCGIEKEIEI